MDKPLGPWVTLVIGVVFLGLGIFLVRANPWARGGVYFLAIGLVSVVVALSNFRRRGRNAK